MFATLTAEAVIRIIEIQSAIVLELVKKLEPAQVQALAAPHIALIEWLRGLVDKIKD